MGSVTYFVAIPFVRTEDGFIGGEPVECPNSHAALNRARAMAEKTENSGALAFRRTGDPDIGEFKEGELLGKFGDCPDDLSEL
jgi:hypothetical protein